MRVSSSIFSLVLFIFLQRSLNLPALSSEQSGVWDAIPIFVTSCFSFIPLFFSFYIFFTGKVSRASRYGSDFGNVEIKRVQKNQEGREGGITGRIE